MVSPLRLVKKVKFVVFLLACACTENNETTDLTKKPDTLKLEAERKFFAGEADLPQGANEITSAGIGHFRLGDSLEKFISLYAPAVDTILDDAALEDGKYWPAKRLVFKNKKYILLEMVNTIDLVTVIRTNEPSFKTRSGLYAGLKLDSLNKPLDLIKADEEHQVFTYGSEGVWFKIDSKSEKNYFKNTDPHKTVSPDAEIKELFIICGDC